MSTLDGFSRGSHTYSVSMQLFALNRQRLHSALSKIDTLPQDAFVVLQGGTDIPRYNTDVNYTFRQESFFHWTFGVEEPDFFGAINAKSGKSYLFIPRLPDSYAIWMGELKGPEHFKLKYAVDEAFYSDEMAEILASADTKCLLLLEGKNTDSNMTIMPAVFNKMSQFKINTSILYDAMSELRVYKTDLEIELLKYACKVSCDAHLKVMKTCRPGLHEYQLESEFLHYCYRNGGARHVGYTCIAGSGHNCSFLHYGHAGFPNSKLIENGDLCLFDMGAEYCCYVSDITVTFPANGKFTSDQRMIYEAVLEANLAVQTAAKPGVKWVDMHLLSQRTILSHLISGGLLKGNVEEMMAVHLGAVFMPHGLGHFMGLDVHDVGGYPKGSSRIDLPSLRNLRTIRTLEPRMVITVEPGCYFIDVLLDDALKDPKTAKFMNEKEINRFRKFGGVRIEDDVLITEDGAENLSPLPRTVEQIEQLMRS